MRRLNPEKLLALITVIILISILAFAGYTFWRNRREESPRPQSFGQADVGGAIPRRDERDVERVAERFVEYYRDALENKDERDAKRAKELVSERGTHVIDLGSDIFNGLRKFTYDLEAPENIIVLNTIRQSENFAETAVKWQLATRTIDRYMYFRKENDEWKLDSIQSIRQ